MNLQNNKALAFFCALLCANVFGFHPPHCFIRLHDSCKQVFESHLNAFPYPQLYSGHPVELICNSSYGSKVYFLGAVGGDYYFAKRTWGIDAQKREYVAGFEVNRIVRINEQQISAIPDWTYETAISRISATRFTKVAGSEPGSAWEALVLAASSLVKEAEGGITSVGKRDVLGTANRMLSGGFLTSQCSTIEFFEMLGVGVEFTEDADHILDHLRRKSPAILDLTIWDQTGTGPPFPLPKNATISVEDLTGKGEGQIGLFEPSFAPIHKGKRIRYVASGFFRNSLGIPIIPAYEPFSNKFSLLSGRTLKLSSPSQRLHSAILLYPKK